MELLQRCESCRFWVQTPADSEPGCHESPVAVLLRSLVRYQVGLASHPVAAISGKLNGLSGAMPSAGLLGPDQWCGRWQLREGA